jgi:hypothetical protein
MTRRLGRRADVGICAVLRHGMLNLPSWKRYMDQSRGYASQALVITVRTQVLSLTEEAADGQA